MNLSAAEKVVNRALWEANPVRYERECLKIRDEHGKLVPLEDNTHQLAMDEILTRQTRLGKPRRLCTLKERKAGISTKSLARMFHAVEYNPADALIVAHDSDSTEYLFSILKRYYDLLPESEKRPIEASNRRELEFSNGGKILVATAGTKTSGRSFTPLYLLCSEAAYYPDPKAVMVSLLNSVPDTPETMVIVESTANGGANWFHDFYWDCKNGNNIYEALFLCWKDLEKHYLPVSNPSQFRASLSTDERSIQSKHGLSLEQLNWRRYAIANKCDNDPDKFRQEYPLTEREAFLWSGRGRFSREALLDWKCYPPLRGYLEEVEKEVTFVPDKEGVLRLWKRPVSFHQYVMGADCAEGIEIEGSPASDRYDHSSAHVADRFTGEVVAHLHGDFEPREYGRQLSLLGRWYNHAYAGVESNNNGIAVLDSMENFRYPTSAIYARNETDEGGRYGTPQRGWRTSQITRANMVNHLATAIRFREFICYCAETQGELLKFVIKASGRTEHDVGAKDDRVFSLGICQEMLGVAPAATTEEQEKELQQFKPIVNRADKYAAIRQTARTQ